MRKIVLRVLMLLVLAVLTVVGGGYLWLRGSLPQLDGDVHLAGLKAPVEVVRDAHAIPHIFAADFTDAAFALGFVHAQDRLWQMEMNRRIGAGRLSEVLGAPTLGIDRFLRMLGLYHYAEATFAHLDARTQAVYTAYAAGVNAFLNQRSGPLPPEFVILGHEPEPWTPVDSLVFLKVMALDLGGNWRNELIRLRLAKRLTPDQIADFFPAYGSDQPHGVLADYPYGGLIDTARLDRMLAALPDGPAEGVGSNNWVVDGAHSETGKPLLANDPHLGLTAPAIWYFAHLSWPGRNLIGATLPGVPAVVLGRSDRIAWGFTNGEPDVQDLYIEKVSPTDSTRYLTPDGTRAFKTRRELIKVKDGDDVELVVRETRHGPVLSDVHEGARATLPDGYVLALAWTALTGDDLTAQAATKLATADNWSEFVAAMRDYHVPQQNIVYADIDGNIGYYAPARIPIRRPDNKVMGYMPEPGWDPIYDWQGMIPFEELPHAFNPPDGMIATANHKVVGDDYPYHLTFDWAAGYRIRRINDCLRAQPRHSLGSFAKLQADDVSLFARDMLPLLRGIEVASPLAKSALAAVNAWDGAMDAGRAEPLIFAAWMREFARQITADDLGDLQPVVWGRKGPFLYRVLTARPAWCDDKHTPAKETCALALSQALETAVAWIAKRRGTDIEDWHWGDEHPAVSAHRPFGQVAGLRDLFDIVGPVGGSTYTVNVGDFHMFDDAHPFAAVHGPGMRAIYDLADPERSRFIQSTGQSGNVLSRYYSDFAAPWRRVDYVPMITKRAAIEDGAIGNLKLIPAAE